MEWRALGAQFAELKKADHDKLSAAWLPPDERNPRWRLGGQLDLELRNRFKDLAGRGAVLLGHPSEPLAFWFWLDLLRRESPHSLSVRQRRRISDETFQVSDGGAIYAVCAASETQCYAIERRAIANELSAYKAVQPSGVTSKPTIEGHFKTDQWAPPWTRICFTAPAMVAATLVLIESAPGLECFRCVIHLQNLVPIHA